MLHFPACSFGRFPLPFPWTHVACMFWFGRLRADPPINRTLCFICVNIGLKGTRRYTTVITGEGVSHVNRASSGPPSWPNLVHLVFACRGVSTWGFSGGFLLVGGGEIFRVVFHKVYCFPLFRIVLFSRTFPFRIFLFVSFSRHFGYFAFVFLFFDVSLFSLSSPMFLPRYPISQSGYSKGLLGDLSRMGGSNKEFPQSPHFSRKVFRIVHFSRMSGTFLITLSIGFSICHFLVGIS